MVSSPVARDLHENQRRASRQAHDLAFHAGDVLLLAPGEHLLHGVFHVAVLFPVGIEVRGLVRNLDVLDQLGNDLVHPLLVDEFLRCLVIHVFAFLRWFAAIPHYLMGAAGIHDKSGLVRDANGLPEGVRYPGAGP